MKISFISLGCPKNLVDTEVMLGISGELGAEIVEPDEAEIVVVNTCAFIGDAQREAEEIISEIARKKGSQKLIVAGCLAQRYGERLFDRFPDIDGLIGSGDFPDLPRVIESLFLDSKRVAVISRSPNFLYDQMTPRMLSTPRSYAYIKIAEGCSNSCSFCLIPRLRGRFRSREIDSVLGESYALAHVGVREAVLIAQDTTRYGIDLPDRPNLSRLLSEMAEAELFDRIRFLYSYPSAVDKELLETMARNPSICNYLDIPIQHIHDDMLNRMRRRETELEIRRTIDMARDIVPGISLRSTVIVGFPGETEAHFRYLLNFIEEIEFDHLGVFEYSAEEGTPAARMSNQVPDEIKRERADAIAEVQNAIAFRRRSNLVGDKLTILVDGYDESRRMASGRAEFQAPEIDDVVLIEDLNDQNEMESLIGEFVVVTVTGTDGYDLMSRTRRTG